MDSDEIRNVVRETLKEELTPNKDRALKSYREEVAELQRGRPSMAGLRSIKQKYLVANPDLSISDLDISPRGKASDRRDNEMPRGR